MARALPSPSLSLLVAGPLKQEHYFFAASLIIPSALRLTVDTCEVERPHRRVQILIGGLGNTFKWES